MRAKTITPHLVCSMITLAVAFVVPVFILSLPHAHAAATTFRVNSLADPGEGICDIAADGCTLHEAIVAANTNSGEDRIYFDLDFSVPETINLTGQLPDITEAVTINGPGANLLTVRRDTGGDYRIFNVTASGVVTFRDLTIRDGRLAIGKIGENGGAGINNASSGTVNVTNCTLTYNSTVPFSEQSPFVAPGGAIFNASGTLTVTNSTLSHNSTTRALGRGGAIFNGGTATITNSVLSDNSTAGGDGGAIYNFGSITVDSSTISDNSATFTFGGGGIHNAGGTLSVTNSTLSGNSASEGGGIFNSGSANVTSSTLSNNSASNEGGAFSTRVR
jgi:hypothetical protein